MKKKKVWRYYCDHCNRSMHTRRSMIKHEPACFQNPNRHCPVCDTTHDMAVLVNVAQEFDLDKLASAVDQCPACMWAAIVQADLKDDDHGFNYREQEIAFNDARYPGCEIL